MTQLRWASLVAALAVLGCAQDEPGDGEAECETDACEESGSTGEGTTGTPDEGSSTSGEPAGDIPCDVKLAIAANCGECHGDEMMFGAPMSLMTLDDLLMPAVTDPTITVYEMMMRRIDDPDSPMPPDSSMTSEDAALITEWIGAGMEPYVGPACEDVPDDDEEPWGPDALPCEPVAEFRAHDGNGGGFVVPLVQDLYQCFVFASPFGAEEQGTAWAPIIEDARVVHHWLLLQNTDPTLQPGDSFPCGQSIQLDSPMLMGWAPGTPNFVMPEEAGLELPGPGENVVLQIHYNNTAGLQDAVDTSGVALCTTETPRENAAATLWLGSLEIDIPAGGTQTVVGDCHTGLRASEPVTMLASWPHMHELGTSIKTDLIRGGNTDNTENLVDVPQWNFNNQIYYPHDPPIQIAVGDVLRTTCVYDNPNDYPVGFGEGTGDEMCFDFSLVYPITAFDFENSYGPPTLGRYCVGLGDSFPFP
jgi:hypothetical protein